MNPRSSSVRRPWSPAAAATAQPAPAPGAGAAFDLKRPEIANFIDEVVREGRPAPQRRATLLSARREPQPKIIEAMTRPVEKVAPWWEYQERFVTAERISDGVQFWTEHRDALEHIAARVRRCPPEYIVAILGVETHYGRNTGHYRVLDALATLAFDYPPREKFFRMRARAVPDARQGEQARPLHRDRLLCRRHGRAAVHALAATGATRWTRTPTASATCGMTGTTSSPAWRTTCANTAGRPAARCWPRRGSSPTRTSRSSRATCELNETVDSLGAHGVKVLLDVPGDTPALLLSAEQPDGPAYRVGFHNFYVITRYNAQRPLRHGGARPGPGAEPARGAGERAARPPRRDRTAPPCPPGGRARRAARGRLLAWRRTARSPPCRRHPWRRRPPPPPADAANRAGCGAARRAAQRARQPAVLRRARAALLRARRVPRATSSAASPPGTDPASTAAAPRAARRTTCTA